jgi:glycosyltransferase involved in cell wall biosynthesis
MGPLLTHAQTLPTGGAETQIFLLARELDWRGSKVCVCVFDLPGVDLPTRIGGVALLLRPPYRRHERLGKLRELFALRRAVISADAGVLVTRVAGAEVGLVGLFAKLARRKFFYSSANISDFDLSLVSPKRVNRLIFRLGIRLADGVIVQTSEQVRLCEQRFRRSPVLIGSICEPAPQRDSEPEAFLWIGRLVPYKQPLAFVELARALPDARFRMIGVPAPHAHGGKEVASAVETAAETVPNLELLPPRPRPSVMDLVERAVAVVNTADHEGMPNTFLEGWARGVPALALTHDPDGVIERHRLGAFAHGSPERLIDLTRQLWETRRDQAAVASRCRQYVLDYHSPRVVAARWQEALGIVPQAIDARVVAPAA